MPKAFSLAVGALGWSTLTIFCVVPAAIWALGYHQVIFSRGDLGWHTALFNIVFLLPLALPWLMQALRPLPVRTWANHAVHDHGWVARPQVLAVLVAFWIAIFAITGGLDYRVMDVEKGYGARGTALQLTLTATNVIVIGACALFVEGMERSPLGHLGVALLLALAAVLALSGSRGVVLQLLLTAWIARHLARSERSDRADQLTVFSLAAALPAAWMIWVRMPRRRLLGLSGLVLAALGVASLGVWGAQRDQQEDVLFATLYRAAEPYWHHAYMHYLSHGPDASVLGEALARVASIPGRWLGLSYPQSIDGSEDILEQKLGIPYTEGVSLPITYVGEGFLFAGYPGALLFQAMVLGLVFMSFRMLGALQYFSTGFQMSFLAAQVVKCLLLYPKSLSGVVLVLFYESARDCLALLLLSSLLGRVPRYVDAR